ncbi:type II toxin-antitoxin system RelE/ParE family toxin [Candidatus Pacearchaeota archaeon]|nr:type II toxin-antitoxin system RelE/ParE family toxin [Candidatus Pacearchaeota archaeon]
MVYTILLSPQAEKFLSKLDASVVYRVRDKLRELGTNPRLGKPMTANLAGFWCLRTWKVRFLYTIQDTQLLVLVMDIDYRGKIYHKR